MHIGISGWLSADDKAELLEHFQLVQRLVPSAERG